METASLHHNHYHYIKVFNTNVFGTYERRGKERRWDGCIKVRELFKLLHASSLILIIFLCCSSSNHTIHVKNICFHSLWDNRSNDFESSMIILPAQQTLKHSLAWYYFHYSSITHSCILKTFSFIFWFSLYMCHFVFV